MSSTPLDTLVKYLTTLDSTFNAEGTAGATTSARQQCLKLLMSHLAGGPNVKQHLTASQYALQGPLQWRSTTFAGFGSGSAPAAMLLPLPSRPSTTVHWDDVLLGLLRYSREVCFESAKGDVIQQQSIYAICDAIRICDAKTTPLIRSPKLVIQHCECFVSLPLLQRIHGVREEE